MLEYPHMAQSLLSWGAFLLYAAACVTAVAYLFNKSERARRSMLSLLGSGLTLHLFAWGARLLAFWALPENRWFLPVNSFFGALSYMALALAAAFFFIEARKKLGILGAFILPDRKSTRLNSSHIQKSRMPSSA